MKKLLISLGLIFTMMVPVAYATTISQGYKTNFDLVKGSIVSLSEEDPEFVEPANTDNAAGLIGVVVGDNDSVIEVEGDASGVQVATDGEAVILVTDLAGEIKPGDLIAPSPVSGVGMKATGDTRVIGVARQNFNTLSGDRITGTTLVEKSDGEVVRTNLGTIQAEIGVSNNTAGAESSSKIPAFLQNLGDTIAGKDVSPARIAVALVVFLIVLSVTFILLSSAIKNSMISIGRNPLSKQAIYAGLFQVMIIAGIVLIIGLGAMYLILRG